MEMKSVFIPVPVDENLSKGWYFIETMKGANRQAFYVPEHKRFDCDNSDVFYHYDVRHILVEKEDVFVLTKEELEKVFEAGRKYGVYVDEGVSEKVATYDDFNDWLNQQSTLISSPISK